MRRSWPCVLGFAAVLCFVGCHTPPRTDVPRLPPNIVVILTDDCGYGEIGCYGQTRIRTPNIDALAAAGIRFTDAYSASPVCAPSRCSLITGRHSGHAAIRDNKEIQPEGQQPLPESAVTIAQMLKAQGYATAVIGKWGLGPPGSSGDPRKHGFDSFFGYHCQRHAHNHYPPFIYRDNERIPLPGNLAKYPSGDRLGQTYAPDLFIDEALGFVKTHDREPFFLLFATPVPHLALQVPEESIAEYRGKFDDQPYDGKRGYIPHPEPRAAYAAMMTRLDRDVGRLVRALRDLPTDRETLVIFTSDNGPTINVGGADSGFFESTAGLRGRKMDLYEGGIRVPLIAAWTRSEVVGVSNVPVASWDLFPTFAAVSGAQPPPGLDGVDLSGLLRGGSKAPHRESLYWEFPSGKGMQAVRLGEFKAVRRNARGNPDGAVELYHLPTDRNETRDRAADFPEVVARVKGIMRGRSESEVSEWNY